MFKKQIFISIKILLLFAVITGLIYPMFITGIAQLFFSFQANGSIMEKNETRIGSKLIGQWFTEDRYFWPRLSSTSSYPYNASASGGSNFGPSNPGLISQAKNRISALADTSCVSNPPIDLVTASASGLDPDISIGAAFCQADRVAKARDLTLTKVEQTIESHTTDRFLGIFGEPRVNVLELNLALDELK